MYSKNSVLNFLLWFSFLFGFSSFATTEIQENLLQDSIPIIIKGKEFFLKNKSDNDTSYYYIYTTADRNEVYDIRTKETLWSRPLEDRKRRPIWKKLPKERKYKEIINGKTYFKYFKNDSLVISQKNYRNKKITRIDYGFITKYDSISETRMRYHIDTGKRYSSTNSGYTRGWSTIPFLLNWQDDWEKKPKLTTNKNYHDHPIIANSKDIIYDVSEQASFISEYKGYKKLSKVETPSRKFKHITALSEENLKDKILLFYNKNLKRLQLKNLDNTLVINTVVILQGSENIYKSLRPKEFIDVSYFSKGIYYITIKVNNKNFVSYRLYLPE